MSFAIPISRWSRNAREIFSLAAKAGKRAGGGAPDHWADEPALFAAAEPYLEAKRELDRREALALRIAGMWRTVAICALVAGSALAGGWFHQAQQSSVQRVFVETRGEDAIKIHITGDLEPNALMMRGDVRRTIEKIFTKDDSDPINLGNRAWLKNHLRGKAVTYFNDRIMSRWQDYDAMEVSRISPLQSVHDKRVWNAEWMAREWANGQPREWVAYRGQFALAFEQPKDLDELSANEFGIIITDMRWAP